MTRVKTAGHWTVFGLCLLATTGCDSGGEGITPALSSAPPNVVQADVVKVQEARVPIRIEVTGRVVAASQATLSSKIRGTIQEIRGREGTAVTKGWTLIVLDSRDLKAARARAEAELEHAKDHLRRMENLLVEEAVSKQDVETATRALRVAKADREAALAQLSYTVIKAPFDGTITEKLVEVGELASPGQALLKIEDPRRLRLEATVAEGNLRAISRGDRIMVVIDALAAAPLPGTVAQVLPTGDPATHTFLVKIDLPLTSGLKSGMFGRLQLETGFSETLVIPRSAQIERGALTGVFVVGPDRIARLRWIKVGRDLGARLEVLSGLNAGEQVLADAARGAEGIRVEIVTRDR